MSPPSPTSTSVTLDIVKPTPTTIRLNMNLKHKSVHRSGKPPKHNQSYRTGKHPLSTPPPRRSVAKRVFSGGCFGHKKRPRAEHGNEKAEPSGKQADPDARLVGRNLRRQKEDQKSWLPILQERVEAGPGSGLPALVWIPETPDSTQVMERQSVLMRRDFEKFGRGDRGPMLIWLPNEGERVWRGGYKDASREQLEEETKVQKANEKWRRMSNAQKRCACRNGECERKRPAPKIPPGLGLCQGEALVSHSLLPRLGDPETKGHSRGSSSMTNHASTRTSADVTISTAATSVLPNSSSLEIDVPGEPMMSGALATAEDESELGMEFSEDERRVVGYFNMDSTDEDDDADSDSGSSLYRSPSQEICQDEVEVRKLFGGRFYDEKRKVWHDWKKRTGVRNVDMGETIGFLVRSGSRAKCGLQRSWSKISRLSRRSTKSRASVKKRESVEFELSEAMSSTLEAHSKDPSASDQHLLSSQPQQEPDAEDVSDSESHQPLSDGSMVTQAEPCSPDPDEVGEPSEPPFRFADFKSVLTHTGFHWSGFDSLGMSARKRRVPPPVPGATRE